MSGIRCININFEYALKLTYIRWLKVFSHIIYLYETHFFNEESLWHKCIGHAHPLC